MYNYGYELQALKYKWKDCHTTFSGFLTLCAMTQSELKEHLAERLKGFGYTVFKGDGYVYAKGSTPILLTAHMDTVHNKQCTKFKMRKEKGKHIVTSKKGIGGDDRCGIHMILKVLESGLRPSVLFCEDEEIGRVGAKKFVKTDIANELKELSYMIELDRANDKDLVFYDCDNPEFTKYMEDNTGFKTSWGSYSDISTLAPFAGVAAVNLSCGYYNAHRTDEYVVVEEMENTIEIVKKLLKMDAPKFEYMEKKYVQSSWSTWCGGSYANRYKSWYDDDYDDWNPATVDDEREDDPDEYKNYDIMFYTEDDMVSEIVEGRTFEEALGTLMQMYPTICYNDILDWDIYIM